MIPFTAKGHRLHNAGDGNFGKALVYECADHPLEHCFEANFFKTLYGNLLPGDSIRVIEMQNSRVMRICDAVVISKKPDEVLVRPLNNHSNNPTYDYSRIYPKRESEAPEEPMPSNKYVEGDAIVQWNVAKRQYAVKLDGQTVAMTKDKSEAESMARGDVPLPA